MFYSSVYLLSTIAVLVSRVLSQENKVSSGNYQIAFCGAGPGSQAAQLQILLPQVWNNLILLRSDLDRGTKSPAFDAFFKTNNSLETVTKVFASIALGLPILVPPRDGNPGSQFVLPTFLCISPSLPIYDIETLVADCKSNSERPIMTIDNSEIILICPSFFDLDDGPSRADCPRLRVNTLFPNDARLVTNKYAALIHELAHIYSPSSPAAGSKETYKVMDAVKLSASRSLKNPNSYALYAAGESSAEPVKAIGVAICAVTF